MTSSIWVLICISLAWGRGQRRVTAVSVSLFQRRKEGKSGPFCFHFYLRCNCLVQLERCHICDGRRNMHDSFDGRSWRFLSHNRVQTSSCPASSSNTELQKKTDIVKKKETKQQEQTIVSHSLRMETQSGSPSRAAACVTGNRPLLVPPPRVLTSQVVDHLAKP